MKRLIQAAVVAGALGAWGPVAQAQKVDEDARLIVATRQFTRDVMQTLGVRGVQIAMARHGTVIWEEGIGYASLSGPTRMTVHTVFSAGSMSKTYTATAVMQLVEQGVLALDEPINTYLRRGADFTVVNPLGAREITIRDLMSHRSGLTSDAGGSELDPPLPLGTYLRDEYARPMLVVYSSTSLPLWSAKVGDKYQYSNLGVATLGYLVEIMNPEHLSFEAYVQRHILDPLGMRSSQLPAIRDSAHLRPELARRFVRGYAKLGAVDLPSPQIYLSAYPAGTLVTTAGDHIRLLLAYLNGGTYAGRRILRPETVKLMLTPGLSPSTGLIWQLWNAGRPDFGFGHGGAYMYGWRNEFRAYPGLDVATVVATNQWDMMSPHYGVASGTIEDFIVSWIEHERAGLRHPQPPTTWAWKCSYVMGLVWVDQIMGGLGVRTPLTDESIDATVRGALVRGAAAGGAAMWDSAGFRAGVDDLRQVAMRPDSIRAFLASDRVRVWPEELNLIYAALDGPPNWVPWPEFAAPAR